MPKRGTSNAQNKTGRKSASTSDAPKITTAMAITITTRDILPRNLPSFVNRELFIPGSYWGKRKGKHDQVMDDQNVMYPVKVRSSVCLFLLVCSSFCSSYACCSRVCPSFCLLVRTSSDSSMFLQVVECDLERSIEGIAEPQAMVRVDPQGALISLVDPNTPMWIGIKLFSSYITADDKRLADIKAVEEKAAGEKRKLDSFLNAEIIDEEEPGKASPPIPDSRFPNHESRIPNPDSRFVLILNCCVCSRSSHRGQEDIDRFQVFRTSRSAAECREQGEGQGSSHSQE